MKEATYIIKTLNKKGYIGYFAGGWVRDYLLDHPSNDIDIATDAPAEVVETIFHHTIPIGKAFGIILVIINNKQYEVATFREDISYSDGRRPTEIKFSSPEKDAKRRDFTINGMFYDPIKKEVIDFVQGQEDLKNKVIRCIGKPHQRFKEDRLRMIRAVRLSARFDFDIDPETQRAIKTHSSELFPSVAIERIKQEFSKMALYKGFKKALITLFDFNLLQTIFPSLKKLSLEDIEKRLSIVDDFPSKTPVIIPILELFPDFSIEQKIELCKYLKLSNQEINFVTFFHYALNATKHKENFTDYDWAYFYANKFCNLTIQILAIHIKANKRKDFLLSHEKKQKSLQIYIDRIKDNDPLVKSNHLKMCDINPGILMGQLLKEAEKISVNEKMKDPYDVIQKLKKTNLWPKH